MGKESSKASARRLADPQYNFLLSGRGIDIGCGDDPVTSGCERWDVGEGDAQLMEGVAAESFDWVYSSHCLEHLQDPVAALLRWWELVKPGGRLLVVVPDEDLYEQGLWPSRFNLDHKHTFRVDKEGSWSPVSLSVSELVSFLNRRKVHWIRTIDHGYDHEGGVWDRTLGKAEANIEFMVEKTDTMPRRHLTFLHSGKLGDIVYSMPTIEALGGGRLYLAPNEELGLTPEGCSQIEPLLLAQEYICSCSNWEGSDVDYALDRFRLMNPERTNLVESHLRAFGLNLNEEHRAWLHVPDRIAVQGLPVAVSRTCERRGVEGFWQAIFKALEGRCFFLGSKEEHASFEREVGTIPYVPTADLMLAATLIAGSRLFVGNQSCLLAIAEGLKVDLIMETDPLAPNCTFYRRGASQVDLRHAAFIRAFLDGHVAIDALGFLFPGDSIDRLLQVG